MNLAQSPMALVAKAITDLMMAVLPRRFKYVFLLMDPAGLDDQNSAMISNMKEGELPELLHGVAAQLENGLMPVERTSRGAPVQ